MCHGDEHENAIRDLVLTDIFSRKPLFLVMHGANMDVKYVASCPRGALKPQQVAASQNTKVRPMDSP